MWEYLVETPRTAVNCVSDCRYVSDCRSSGREFDPARSHTLAEIDHEIISMAILPLPLIQGGCCQLQAKLCTQRTG